MGTTEDAYPPIWSLSMMCTLLSYRYESTPKLAA